MRDVMLKLLPSGSIVPINWRIDMKTLGRVSTLTLGFQGIGQEKPPVGFPTYLKATPNV